MGSMQLFRRNVKNIKGVAHKNGKFDGTCKRTLEECLHIPIPSPSPSSFIIVPMVTGCLTGKMVVEPILPVTISTIINLDGDGDGVGMCKQAFNVSRTGIFWLRSLVFQKKWQEISCIM